ncbi:MAG: NAD-dependent deacetylase [Actinomycetia bacterium]|jgi:NAD-dependent deacetylase|nr:NAD-dependent deacetylase [Actinomycetes bacterium]MDQ1654068.1 NAD-dependent deacetylase [Cryptosporangiaceae bacterium]MDQ1657992.1 NAD-dependent deacetylase [Cryptosporangiaceae bacterium]
MRDMQTVAAWIAAADRVTVLTGAGISTDSGIPDFRGPNGLWTQNPGAQRLFTLRDYIADPDIRREAWRIRRQHAAWTARPNPGHYALVELENTGRLRAIITQNIDGLHQLAGNTEDLVIEVHGSLYEVECLSCHTRTAMSDTLERVAAGEEDPACLRCGGILKAGTISFGQPLVPAVFAAARSAAAECDVFLAIGTSLSVQPVAGLVDVASRQGAKIVIINADRTPYDSRADARLDGPIGEILPSLISAAAEKPAASAG